MPELGIVTVEALAAAPIAIVAVLDGISVKPCRLVGIMADGEPAANKVAKVALVPESVIWDIAETCMINLLVSLNLINVCRVYCSHSNIERATERLE